jgi:PleD family two-component response regulator
MKLLNEIITDLLKEEEPLLEITLEDIDNLPGLEDDFGHDTWLSEEPT